MSRKRDRGQSVIHRRTFFWLTIAFLAHGLCTVGFAQSSKTGILGEGQSWQTPYYIQETGIEGPTVIITGGVHGNEPAGARAAEQIRQWPIVCGKVIVIPRVNTFALEQNTRYIPKAKTDLRDLNRNFPSPQIASEPRGKIATALWDFVVEQNPDWLFDLHEGYEFHISHHPKNPKDRSVGSSIIYKSQQGHGVMVERMLAAANGNVTDADRKFVPLGRGPKKTSLAAGVINVLGKKAMILETTYNHQPLAVRTHQHREMMNVALRHLEMIDADVVRLETR